MKTIGIIGGMSWQSTQTYYQLINQGIKKHLGGLHSAKIILYSVDFAEVEAMQSSGDWSSASEVLCRIAERLVLAGADAVLIATNTMHKVADEVRQSITVPLLHIADATGRALQCDQRRTVALLGTQFTMQESFYRAKLVNDYELKVVLPDLSQQQEIHRIIYAELCLGIFAQESRDTYARIIESLAQAGADSVALACTEIPLLT